MLNKEIFDEKRNEWFNYETLISWEIDLERNNIFKMKWRNLRISRFNQSLLRIDYD